MADKSISANSTANKPRTASGEAARYLKDVVLNYEGDECLTWPFVRDGHGYGHIRIKGIMRGVHRVVCEAAHGAPPDPTYHAAHECGKGHLGCVAKRHLSWKTVSENALDRTLHGTSRPRSPKTIARRRYKGLGQARGERVVTSKLTESDIRQIRALKGVVSGLALAKMFGVGAPHISRIQNGAKWAHIT